LAPAAATPTPPPTRVDRAAASQERADPRLLAAGALAIVGGMLTFFALFPAYLGGYRPANNSADVQTAVILAVLACGAGIGIFVPRTRRLIGPGFLLGAVATAPIGPLYAIILPQTTGERAGASVWLNFVAGMVLVVAACLVGIALARAGEVRLVPRPPHGALPWLVVLLGVASAVAFFFQVRGQELVPGRGQAFKTAEDLAPVIWASAMALVVPVAAALAVPRQFGVALLAGWIGNGAAGLVYYTGFRNGLFAYILLALLIVIVPFARANRRAPDHGRESPPRAPGSAPAEDRGTSG